MTLGLVDDRLSFGVKTFLQVLLHDRRLKVSKGNRFFSVWKVCDFIENLSLQITKR